jgi:signal transduction histidine kinase
MLAGAPEFGTAVILLAVYLLTLLVEPPLLARRPAFLHILNLVQTVIAFVLITEVTDMDFFALLFIPPCTQSILYFSRRPALAWIIAIVLVMVVGLVTGFPRADAVGFVIIYPTAIFLFTSLSYLAMTAEEAQLRSEALLADLQKANQRLQAYSLQVQELAAAAERNRLARELHDSVTQIIFGLTLSAQAARILIDRNPAKAAAELDHLQVLAQNALAEMRALIQELRPASATAGGLAPALRRLAAERLSADGLAVDLRLQAERRLPEPVEAELYRIAQEALHNVVKHARTDTATLTLDLADPRKACLCIEDRGAGFDPALVANRPGHLGLTSMSERVQALGGRLAIHSQPGQGTQIQVEIDLDPEESHAG